MNERLTRFSALLKQMFELDKSDLDFGIYRVMNLRREEIEQFLSRQLPDMVQKLLAPFARDDRDKLKAQMAQIEQAALSMGTSVEALPETAPSKQTYRALQRQLAEGGGLAAMEDFQVYARSATPNGPYKNGPGEINFPVSVGGQVINPGDILVGDGDSVLVIKPEDAEQLAREAAAVQKKEQGQIEGILSGKGFPRPFVEQVLEQIGVEYVD